MRKIRFLVVSLILVSLVVGIRSLLKSRLFDLSSIEIELDPHSSESFLFEKTEPALRGSLAPFIGLPFWRVRLKDVMEVIQRDRRVRTAHIERDFPHRIKVTITPHEPLIGCLDEFGRVHPVARDATLLPSVPLKDMQNFPLLRGREFFEDQSLRLRAIQLLELLPDTGLSRRDSVSEILHSKNNGFEIFLTGSAAEIRLGEDEFELKMGRVEKVLSYLQSRSLNGRVIDARFSKKVVVRLRSGHTNKVK